MLRPTIVVHVTKKLLKKLKKDKDLVVIDPKEEKKNESDKQ